MYIFLCEDNKEHEKIFLISLKEVLEEMKLPFTVETFETAEGLLNTLADKLSAGVMLPDIIFSDIELPCINGIELGKQILQMTPDVCLILLTSFAEYAVLGYETRAYRYLLKPVKKEDLCQIFTYITQKNKKSKMLILGTSEAEKVISVDDIVYMSAEDKYTIIHTFKECFIDRKSLQFYEEQLRDMGYFRIHRKYLINVRHHKSLQKGKVILDNDEKIPISRRKETEYHSYLLNRLERGICE